MIKLGEKILSASILSSLFIFNVSCISNNIDFNNRPIVGILSQGINFYSNLYLPNLGLNKSFIPASYVKFVESGGARVVPIMIGKPFEYYKDLMGKINGVVFPGGGANFYEPNGYADAGRIIYEIAKEFNEKGDYFPIWGVCLGFELLTFLAANGTEPRVACESYNHIQSLKFTSGYNNSRLFGNAPKEIIDILQNEEVNGYYHHWCITIESLEEVNLQDTFRVLSLGRDQENTEFVSTVEHVKMPFYGVQYHPEKNLFEWHKNRRIPHSPNASKTTHYFSEFFVNEARKSLHKFANASEEEKALIYNYVPTYTGLSNSPFTQAYLFE